MTLESLKDLSLEQLRDVYSAEKQLVEALPKMVKHASHAELQDALEEHLGETRTHVERLEKIFDAMNVDPQGEKCEAMDGLIEEAEELLEKDAEDDVLDAGLIASAQRVEHYEIAAYGTLATYAERLGRKEDHDLLGETLSEEKEADGKLNRIAKSVVNADAVAA